MTEEERIASLARLEAKHMGENYVLGIASLLRVAVEQPMSDLTLDADGTLLYDHGDRCHPATHDEVRRELIQIIESGFLADVDEISTGDGGRQQRHFARAIETLRATT